MNLKQELFQILQRELRPALGCTEPAAVALAAAHASRVAGGKVKRVVVKTDPNVYKNGMGVYVPNSGEYGLDVAAALGAIGGDPDLGLEALQAVTEDDLAYMKCLLATGKVEVKPVGEPGLLHIEVTVFTEQGEGKAEIAGVHDNLVTLVANQEVLLQKTVEENASEEVYEKLFETSIRDILATIMLCDKDELEFLLEGAEINVAAAKVGLDKQLGLGIGAKLQQLMDKNLLGSDLVNKLMSFTAAASDARMSGYSVPIMSTNGSGNQGITASVPIYLAAQELASSEQQLLQALAISQTVTVYVKHYMGRLSALCACAVAASVGVSCGLTFLMGGTVEHIERAIKNMAADLTGMICDGAKLGCALKLATAVGTATQIAMLTLEDLCVPATDGIVAVSAEETIHNIGKLSNPGMVEADKVILKVMMDKFI